MAAQHTQIETNKQEFRWSFRKKGKDVLKLCRQFTVVMTVAGGLIVITNPALANPSGGNVTGGAATIVNSGTTTTINQTSHRAIIEWNNFDIAAGETTQFIQPSSSAIALNRVVNSSQATAINGNLTANGRVLVINPNGVLIGPSGNVDVSGFVASSADISNARFMTATGAMEFDRAGKVDATVENQGRITIRDAGLGVLVAPVVRNSGVIEGNMAKLHLGAGDTFGVDLYGDGLLHLAVGNTGPERTIKAENSGTIVANAGKVVMTAAAANNVVNSVINTSGVIEAKGLVAKGGSIILTGAGADIKVAGKVDASGKTGGGSVKIGGDVKGGGTLAKAKTVDVTSGAQISADAVTTGDGGTIAVWSDQLTTTAGRYSAKGGSQSGKGGFVETSSKETLNFAGTFVDTSAAFGAYGLWLLDPTDFTINASNVGSINTALSNVSLSATGNFYINTNVNIAKAGVGLTINSAGDITMNNQTITLNGGDLVMKAGGTFQSNNSNLVTKGGDVDVSGNILRVGHNTTTAGGNVKYAALGALEMNNKAIMSAGGDVALSAVGGLSINNSEISTAGGDVLVEGGSVSTNNFNVNTTGGSTAASVSLVVGGTPKTFSQVYNTSNSKLQQTGNAGNVTVKGGSVAGNQMCISAGGGQCGTISTAATPATIALAIKGNDVYKTYGSLDPALTYTVSTGALMSGDNFTGALVRAAGNNVGSYAINQGTLNVISSGGYTYVITYTPGTFTINPAFLTITAQNQGKTYGDTLNLGSSAFTTSGLVSGDSVTGVNLSSTGAAAGAGAGSYAINANGATGSGLSNYNITYQDGTLSVGKAALTMTASNFTKTYGQLVDLSGPLATFSGLKNGDVVDSGYGVMLSGGHAKANVGTYNVSATFSNSAILSNYNVTLVNGKLTVTPAALNIVANNQSKTYGDALTLSNSAYTTSGLMSWDSITGVNLNSTGAAMTANAGNHAINASGATGTGLSNYSINYVSGNLLVNKAALTVTANNQSKTYGDALALGTTAYTSNGLKAWDSLTGVTLNSSGAAAGAGAGSYAINASGATGSGVSNYDVTYQDGTLNVGKAALTMTASSYTKTYGQTVDFSGPLATFAGLKNGDVVDSGYGVIMGGAHAKGNVGTYTVRGSFNNSAILSNYNVNIVNGTLTVTPAALTIVANNQSKTYGDTLTLGNSAYTSSGLMSWDSITGVNLSSAGTAATANAGSYAINANGATGTGLSNYNITYQNGNLNVGRAALILAANNRTKTYGDTLALGNTAFTASGLRNGDTVGSVNLSSSGTSATANVGNYAIAANGAAGTNLSNYDITYTSGNLLINPALLTVTANNRSKTYGDLLALGNTAFTVSGLRNSDTVNTVNLSSAGATGTANAGNYAINASGANGSGLSNYTVNYTAGNLLVNRAALTVTANNRVKTYGDSLNLGNTAFTTAGLKNSDSVSSVTLSSSGRQAGANVGSYSISASNAAGNGLSNYNVSYVGGTLVVNPANLTITARDQLKIYGDYKNVDNALFAYTVSGLKNFDFVTDVNLASAGGAATANVGNYDITANGAAGFGLSNYNINYVKGTLNVNPALLLITSDSFSKTYGSAYTFDNNDYAVYGLKNADSVTGVMLSSNGAAATANVGLYGITGSNATGTGLSNYNIVYTPGLLLVNPAALTVTALNQTKTYGTNLNLGSTAFTVSGLKNTDTVNSVVLNSAGAAGTANAGSYAITANGAAGNGLSNYVISYNGATLNVDRANLTVVANNQVKKFGSTFVFNGTEFTTVGNLYNGDTVNNVTLTSPGEAANASAINSPYNIYASNATGSGLSNYNVSYVNGRMTVNPAPYTPAVVVDALNRPIVSVANNVIVRDGAFEAIETRTLDTDVALRYRGSTSTVGNGAAVLASLEPAAGGDDEVSAEDLANLEPAAGGDAAPASNGNSDVDCANSFLDNQPCGIVQ